MLDLRSAHLSPSSNMLGKNSVHNAPVFVQFDIKALGEEIAHQLLTVLTLNLTLRDLAQAPIR